MDEYPGCAPCRRRLRHRSGRRQKQKDFRKMNRKQLIILLVLVVVLGGTGIMLHNRQKSSWEGANPAAGKKLLGDFPMNDVAHIEIKQGGNALNLAKKADTWSVRERNDYPANYSQIRDLLIKLGDLKIVQSEPVGQSQLA